MTNEDLVEVSGHEDRLALAFEFPSCISSRFKPGILVAIALRGSDEEDDERFLT
jgi:hypothetical protein